ncbi:hypothetical protein GCM10027200_85210 [Lentzea nigeriaca]
MLRQRREGGYPDRRQLVRQSEFSEVGYDVEIVLHEERTYSCYVRPHAGAQCHFRPREIESVVGRKTFDRGADYAGQGRVRQLGWNGAKSVLHGAELGRDDFYQAYVQFDLTDGRVVDFNCCGFQCCGGYGGCWGWYGYCCCGG